MEEILKFESYILKELFQKAVASERKRAAHVLRSSDKGKVPAIMFDCFLPGTYVRPHCHPCERETWVFISGRAKVIIFNEDGTIKEIYEMSNTEKTLIEFPPLVYHTIVALEPAILCEFYHGIYDLATYKKFADWAPEENNSQVQEYLEQLSKKVR